jgi:hypothetical protein
LEEPTAAKQPGQHKAKEIRQRVKLRMDEDFRMEFSFFFNPDRDGG